MSGNPVTGAVDRATESPWFEHVARAGHAVSGLLHLLIAYIIVRLAFGDTGTADQSGALGIFAGNPGGRLALWVAAAAFAGLALWRIAEAILGPHPTEPGKENDGAQDWLDRGKALSLAVVYVGFAWTAVQFALGSGQSSGKQNAGLTARLMESGGGKFVVVVAGLIIIGVGVYHVYKGASRSFLDDLKPPIGRSTSDDVTTSRAGAASGDRAATIAGVVGYCGKGLVLIGTGILVIVAVATADPSKASGIDGTVKSLAELPAGQVLMILAAIGIAAYGVYCYWLTRYARM
ncbi:DUF1206 domain-containing protein [Gordonia amicalis]|uniref:DUF1206 domain-containing protein n=1 Tax=Gordonia amicalis TaxID=89053 RepID=UPI0002A63E0C|nr:DUF1206 domain-containing protein [Gordonia amicalis]MDV7173063.1 DUF1206 domain-containing protein [Gordonia amicalis]NKX77332.1 DUF1206 domain-containing protein [Gordonia amicalis]GAC54834.1 hypothetical protein GOAMI_38_00310 [Gordonia amicalis NBRC 100051 = JCM 11271]